MANLQIRWTNPGARGWTDVIPMETFEREEVRGFAHSTSKSGVTIECQATADISGRVATIEYGGPHLEMNLDNEVYIGQTIVVFANAKRDNVVSVFWRDDADQRLYDLDAEFRVID